MDPLCRTCFARQAALVPTVAVRGARARAGLAPEDHAPRWLCAPRRPQAATSRSTSGATARWARPRAATCCATWPRACACCASTPSCTFVRGGGDLGARGSQEAVCACTAPWDASRARVRGGAQTLDGRASRRAVRPQPFPREPHVLWLAPPCSGTSSPRTCSCRMAARRRCSRSRISASRGRSILQVVGAVGWRGLQRLGSGLDS
jgi:hypothetical protein